MLSQNNFCCSTSNSVAQDVPKQGPQPRSELLGSTQVHSSYIYWYAPKIFWVQHCLNLLMNLCSSFD